MLKEIKNKELSVVVVVVVVVVSLM